MRDTSLRIAALLAVFATATIQAGELVGFTGTNFTGDHTIAEAHQQCTLDFPGSHWCTSAEIIRGVSQDAPTFQQAWVQPSIVAGNGTEAVDASGQTGDPRGELTCVSWTEANAAFSGLRLVDGNFSTSTCDQGSPVACCR